MSKFHFVIAIILSTYHVSYAGRLTRQCKAINGTCGEKDLTCDGRFGTGWTSFGKCCGERPCCKFQCEDIQPQQFPNGTVIITGQEIGATANFSCESGFRLNGTMVITCTDSGWNGDIPECLVQCENIHSQPFPNGTVSITGQDIGATASFSCDSGFGLNGTMVITCTESGWNGDIPKCVDPCDPDRCAPRGLICRSKGLEYVCVVDFIGK